MTKKSIIKIFLTCLAVLIIFVITLIAFNVYKQYRLMKFLPVVANGTPEQVETQVKKVKWFINEPVSIYNGESTTKFTPIMIAAMKTKYPEVIDILLNNGAKYIYIKEMNNIFAEDSTLPELAAEYNPNPYIFKKFLELTSFNDVKRDPDFMCFDLYNSAIRNNKNAKVLEEVINICKEDTFQKRESIPYMLTKAIAPIISLEDNMDINAEQLQIVINATKKYNIDFNSKDKKGKTALDYIGKGKINPELQKILDKNHIKLKSGITKN